MTLLADALKSVVSIQNECKDRRIWHIVSSTKPYLQVGTCLALGMIKSHGDRYEIFQKLSSTSTLYKNQSSIVMYKKKSGLPNYLRGIFKVVDVFQYNTSNGGTNQIPEIVRITDFKESALLNNGE